MPIVDQFKTKRDLTPINVIVLGPPLSGKTTLCKQLVKEYGFHHLQYPNFANEVKSGIALLITHQSLESPDSKTDPNILLDSLRSKLRSWRCQNQGYILDGFPLTMSQATILFKGKIVV